MGTELVEIELGNSRNESTTIALSKAIEGAVLELITIGYDRDFGNMKNLKLRSLIVMMIASPLYAADNEIYLDQSGTNT